MTADKVKTWLLALLSANTTVTDLYDEGADAITSSGQDFPSDEGVYVRILSSAPADVRGFESVDVRIAVVRDGESGCYEAIDAVRNAIWLPAGSLGRPALLPSASGLSLRFLSPVTVQSAPEPVGQSQFYGAVLSVKVIGRDVNAPD